MAVSLRVVNDDRGSWLEWRRQGLGASDAAAIAGFSPFDTPTSIYLKKVGLVTERAEEADWQRMGRLLEPVIAALFEEETGYHVTNVRPQLCITHPLRPWMRATPDGLVEVDGEPVGPVEFKSALRWNGDWREGVPDYYEAQVRHQMEVGGWERGWIAVLVDGRRFQCWEIERDQLAADLLVSIEEAFWRRVIGRRPPPVDDSSATNEALKNAHGEPSNGVVVLDEKGHRLVEEFRSARAAKLAAEKALTAAENKVMALLGNATEAVYDGKPLLRWPQYERATDDLSALREQGVEIPKKTTTYRQFRLVGKEA